jgi:glutamate---cysteine ligase / carboxylate-amine ligase
MALEPFATSRPLSLGVELELQVVSTHDYDLTPGAADLLRVLAKQKLPGEVKPEIAASMIEISTGVCAGYAESLAQLQETRDILVEAARKLGLGLCGGGTHPFQHWSEQRIFDAPRFQHLSELYGYLSKQFIVFGQHVHVGCSDADGALGLLHTLSRFIPHFVALSASSPFVQSTDTGFNSARLNSVQAFPLSGRAPFVTRWEEFLVYFDKMARTGVVEGMKDFYWDIRPKPEFGTIEIRVMDTPLTIIKAAQLAAYIQTVARWQLKEKKFTPEADDYLVYKFNRFQACRFGFDGTFVDPKTGEHRSLRDDIIATLDGLESHAIALNTEAACMALREDARVAGNDATWIRALHKQQQLLPEVVRQQCLRWQT